MTQRPVHFQPSPHTPHLSLFQYLVGVLQEQSECGELASPGSQVQGGQASTVVVLHPASVHTAGQGRGYMVFWPEAAVSDLAPWCSRTLAASLFPLSAAWTVLGQ